MRDRILSRLDDILDAIDQIELILKGRTFDDILADRATRAAFERFIEIISEASRHIPNDLKQSSPETPWRRIADIGNHLRHAYSHVDAGILWDIYDKGDLARLRAATAALIGKVRADR
jgi:uncharacterized protein with HEPN domain